MVSIFSKQRASYIYVSAIIAVAALALSVELYRTDSSSGVRFGDVSLTIEFATTTAARERGLSGRMSLPEDYGMLFAFPSDEKYGIWMKDTLIPLDIFWLNDKGHVVSIAEDVSPATYPNVFYPLVPARYVLETRAGFAQRHAIATGTPLQLPSWPSVSE